MNSRPRTSPQIALRLLAGTALLTIATGSSVGLAAQPGHTFPVAMVSGDASEQSYRGSDANAIVGRIRAPRIEPAQNQRIRIAQETPQQQEQKRQQELQRRRQHEQQQQQRQQMNSKNSKSGTCKKPGKSKGQNPGSKGQLGQARQLQEQLNQQMKQLREQMGKQEGGTKGSSQQMKPSSKSGKGSGGVGTAEQFARMAAQQEAIRLQLLEALQRMKQQGMKAGKDLAEMMENTERELVNKQISPELIQRQQDILTRLLEQEQAEREQDEDFKREKIWQILSKVRLHMIQ